MILWKTEQSLVFIEHTTDIICYVNSTVIIYSGRLQVFLAN